MQTPPSNGMLFRVANSIGERIKSSHCPDPGRRGWAYTFKDENWSSAYDPEG